jgi:ubiquitin-protein ligase
LEGRGFDFKFEIPPGWRMDPPAVIILTRTWHPNMTEQGKVCLSILKDTYTPVMTIDHLIAGLQFMFVEPCAFFPLNHMAAQLYKHHKDDFQQKVNESIARYCPK